MKYLPSIISSLLCLCTALALAISQSMPGCPEKCGNITIPYPFGIGSKCSANSWFEIICQNSTTPFLTSINMEALSIWLNGGLRVTLPVTPMNCSDSQKTQYVASSLQGTPFFISSKDNVFAVLGCQNSVWLPDAVEGTVKGGCMATCYSNSTDTSCKYGVNCCRASIPALLQELQYTYETVGATTNDNNTNNSFCGYAFPVETIWFQEDYTRDIGLQSYPLNPYDPQFVSAPLILVWELDNPVLSDHASCDYSNQYDSSYYSRFCSCNHGFVENPYLRGGCIDRDGHTIRGKIKIVVIGAASGLGVLILVLGAWILITAIRKRIKANCKHEFFKRNGGLLLQQQLSSNNDDIKATKLFSSKELAQATDDYSESRVLGRGGQGTVYKGMLTDGRIVAVKKSKRVDESDLEVFINEVVILSQINHRNVVKLLGCCLETEVPLLVYEFIPNGTLFQHIHEPGEDFRLSWEMRVRIAREVAGALSYLHSAASAPIYHRDIKSTNVLLDDKYWAKVADFGTSRSVSIDQTHLTTRVLGTFGYLDPQYFQSSKFTEKSDVYSFGVVIVELLTGEKAVTPVRAEEGRSLATHFLHSMEENRLFEILDQGVLTEGKREEIEAIAALARRCLDLNGKRRPTMKEVDVALEGIQMHFNQDDSTESHAVEIGEMTDDFSSISGRTD